MYAVSGYIDKNTVIANENISSYEGYNVIITILDSVRNRNNVSKEQENRRIKAARELAGLWKNHDTDLTVEATIRGLRRGRYHDI